MKKLYMAYVWGDSKDRLIEDHEIIFVVAENPADAKRIAKEKTVLTSGVHVDVMSEIKNIDGYDISLNKSDNKEEIVKVLGYYTDI